MKTPAQLAQSIERFRRAFWDKQAGDRPPVGIADSATFLPIGYLRQPFERQDVKPGDVTSQLVRTDYEQAVPQRRVWSDDQMMFATPWRAIPWIEAMCGCPVLYADGSLRPGHFVAAVEDLDKIALPAQPPWRQKMLELAAEQVAGAAEDCFVSSSILRGPADVLAAMRGQVDFFMDLMDQPQVIGKAAQRVNQLLIETLQQHFALVPAKHGGYVHSYGYWAPFPTVVIQEDAMGLCQPEVYRDWFMPLDAATTAALGRGVFFHLHSTGMAHYRHVLEIRGLEGLELSVESTGPTLEELVPVLREILERSRLILFAEHYFEQLPAVLGKIPREGLFLIVPDTHIQSEEALARFLKASFGR
ncbi:MAG: hypothetical protein IT443_07350 [Phycisphaeraceae bacterium]|nr:hypothetical protein [Phycisphaeraceae bacterium]